MRFAIDVVFVDGTLRVKKIVPALAPWRMASAHGAWGVVELATGEVERTGLVIGDQLGVVQVTDRLGAFMANSEWEGGLWDGDGFASANGHVASHDLGVANGFARLHGEARAALSPTKVLLVGADRRFRSVAAALLTRRGCMVTLTDRSSNIAELATSEAADVVVVDVGVTLNAAAEQLAELKTLEPRVGVVLVADETERPSSEMPVLARWGSFDVLYRAIERAHRKASRRPQHGSRR
jgi:CheY-like chemotaxis protein